ncbi:MAG: hypothetical protein WA667_12605 [Candidatus Nitrosopolaris sp.]
MYLGHTKFKKTSVGEIPESWNLVKLEDVSFKIIKGIFDLDPENHIATGVPFLRISDIRDNSIDLSNVKYISSTIHERFPTSL